MTKHWRYRIHRAYIIFVANCGRPARMIEIKLWEWCHYTHGSGAHLNTKRWTWRQAWRNAKYTDV